MKEITRTHLSQCAESGVDLDMAEVILGAGNTPHVSMMLGALERARSDGGPPVVERWRRFERSMGRVYGPTWLEEFEAIASQTSRARTGNQTFKCLTKSCREFSLQGPCDLCIVGGVTK